MQRLTLRASNRQLVLILVALAVSAVALAVVRLLQAGGRFIAQRSAVYQR